MSVYAGEEPWVPEAPEPDTRPAGGLEFRNTCPACFAEWDDGTECPNCGHHIEEEESC